MKQVPARPRDPDGAPAGGLSGRGTHMAAKTRERLRAGGVPDIRSKALLTGLSDWPVNVFSVNIGIYPG
jgi:hypothetical protein